MQTTTHSAWSRRSNNFDFLRLALAVLVIFSHSYPLGTGSESWEPVARFTRGQMTGGAVAVNLFFIMSGFLIAASAQRSDSLLDFMKKRVLRIYPAFLACALLTAVIVMPLASATLRHESSIARIGDFILQTLRLREFHYAGAFSHNPYPFAINGSVWSIQYEFWCYVGVALLLASGLLRQRALVLAAFCVSLMVSLLFQVQGWIFGGKVLGVAFGSPQLWARLLPLYLAGVVFYLFRDRIRHSGWLGMGSFLLILVAARTPHGCSALFPIAGTYLVFYIAFSTRFRLYQFGRYGDFSYGAYLYAFPIQQLLMNAFGRAVSPWILFLCATPLTLAAAVLSWYGVERHFLQRVRGKETLSHALAVQHLIA